ncbi:MAG: hypothetical protein HQL46_14750 [Gammaproteobacteria bacterium]|nr:hypothetical protein [Gammaproteobacteria bacterium]
MVSEEMDEGAKQFLAVASVQAELFAVTHISKRISLSAKNAKAIAARAGSQALGFHPITDFIDDVATNITLLVEEINVDALRLSSFAIANRNRMKTIGRVKDAQETLGLRADDCGLTNKIKELESTKEKFLIEYGRKSSDVLEALTEIRTQLQAAEMICTTSRTEATRAGDFQSNLEVVAEEVSQAVMQIKDVLQTSKLHLSQLTVRRR